MRTEEKLRQAERTGDYQLEVKILIRIGKIVEAHNILFREKIHDCWGDSYRPCSNGIKTYYACPHCKAPSDYQIKLANEFRNQYNLKRVPIECYVCGKYYLG